jgi:hypothetical protein
MSYKSNTVKTIFFGRITKPHPLYKKMKLTTDDKSHETSAFYLFVDVILVTICYIIEVHKQNIFFSTSLVLISYTHFFIIAYKLHSVWLIERRLSSSIHFRHLYIYIYMSIFKEIIIKNKTIFFSIVLISMTDDLIRSQTVRYSRWNDYASVRVKNVN